MKKFDFNKVKEKLGISISSEEALKDVTPFKWSQDVLEGTKKITVSGVNK
jgi:hypothetical protein